MKKKLVIITGISGAGKNTALEIFENQGYFCTDNLPGLLLEDFLRIIEEKDIDKIAVSIDIRSKHLFVDLKELLKKVQTSEYFDVKIIFLDSDDQVLVNRFKETRKNHPLSVKYSLLEGIKRERVVMADVKEVVNYIYDTSNFTVKDLQTKILEDFGIEKRNSYHVTISSFGYKYGIPIDADNIIDVRFLKNPFYIKELREKTGRSEEVFNYVFSDRVTAEFYDKFKELIFYMIDKYQYEGRDKVAIAIGCTGGKHRSVSIARKLYEDVKNLGYRVYLEHRDIDKGR
ncbi:RNase adapter RapZ [Gemella bergeri]